MKETPKIRRRSFRFSLRALFLLVTAICVAIAIAPLVFAFVAAIGIIAWSFVSLVISGRAGNMGRFSYLVVFTLVATFTFWSTFYYQYYANRNTLVHGWPVSVVIFQRVDSTSPWLDFVGITTLLGYPMNFVIFMALPALIFLLVAAYQPAQVEPDPPKIMA